MWGTFTNYLSQYYSNDDTTQDNETDDTEGWVLIDKDGNEIQRKRVPTPQPETEAKARSLSPLPLLNISNTSSPQSSPQLSPTKIEDGWLVAPPPCFTVNCPSQLEISPLEDLLIEHPSMSVYSHPDLLRKNDSIEESCVYDSIPSFFPEESILPHSLNVPVYFKRDRVKERTSDLDYCDAIPRFFSEEFQNENVRGTKKSGLKTLEEAEHRRSESAEGLILKNSERFLKFQKKNKKAVSAERLQPYKRPEESTLLKSQSENSENADERTFETGIPKKNPLTKPKTCSRIKIACQKSPLDLKSYLEQTENMKPAQQAKWANEQSKLCPSYLLRQNRVHRYQSRNHHNQKKKSLAKPFAEKGGHGF